ncbi:putative UPF0602 protein C4orf47-like protein [Hypsibius exemplaris]|uniref:Cilia-and flagella-associated protein 96 n=1 Tax=Hypsibius exemplaris TaxID=2072580 RepID=A0A1W0WDY9_HYPEX|nr:putative UPF0602 protein C4orf47-like protein [Hypsibius exemplaris]
MPSRMIIPNIKAPHDPAKRSDMERTGLFIDMGGLRSQAPYIDFPIASSLRPELRQGKQMMSRGPKRKTAKRDCYFDKEERRLFEGDSATDPIRLRHQTAMAQRKKDIAGRWMPPRGRISTFAVTFDALSAAWRPRTLKEPYRPDFVAGAPKLGSYGWNGYTLNKYPEHLPDPYDGPSLTKDSVETDGAAEQRQRLSRKPYKAVGLLRNPMYFNKNPYLVENPPTKPQQPAAKPVHAFTQPSAFIPPAHPKPMKQMKYWGTFNKVLDLGGGYVSAPTNPFRPGFHGKQTLAYPLIPPAGTKRTLVTPVTIQNMAGQMDVRKADKQETVYGPNGKKTRPFPVKPDKVKEQLALKGKTFRAELYTKPKKIQGNMPDQLPTQAPDDKPWFC